MKKYVFLFFALFITKSLFAQTLTLAEAVSIALKNSLDIEVLNNNVEIAKTNNHIGIAGGLPTISATINDNQSRTNVNQKLNTGVEIKRDGASANQMTSNVSGTVLLYNGQRVKTTQKKTGTDRSPKPAIHQRSSTKYHRRGDDHLLRYYSPAGLY